MTLKNYITIPLPNSNIYLYLSLSILFHSLLFYIYFVSLLLLSLLSIVFNLSTCAPLRGVLHHPPIVPPPHILGTCTEVDYICEGQVTRKATSNGIIDKQMKFFERFTFRSMYCYILNYFLLLINDNNREISDG